MPKGQPGCHKCGQPTTRVVQVTLRDILGWTATPRERTIDAVQRSYCQPCGQRVYETIARTLSRQDGRGKGKARGCGNCGGGPIASRIQLWARDLTTRGIQDTQRTTPGTTAINTSYCAQCRDRIYDAATDPLDGGNWSQSPTYDSYDFAGARAARAAKTRIGAKVHDPAHLRKHA